ncbi:MAG: hypothetical protein HC772_01675 [Leptolyngbyaceae cyanobacterium CRU_2_3]|nr:hypothetical protein [Leptolyngbyaceae cyanobacterium CRU_2_3]
MSEANAETGIEDVQASLQKIEHSPSVPTPTAVPAPHPDLAAPMTAIAAWSENAAHSTDSADITDLISLIQELNQCNSILLDRVSQLEEALETSQIALQAEVGRSQDYQLISQTPLPLDPCTFSPNEMASAQEQMISLFNQLEFAHQANQRQQILIETLTGQLESSQERAAELEREAALIQQRYNEQVQFLSQSETTNRDLQARLHRQQRYTLQFKAALEKCLEVPTPQYNLGPEASAAAGENPFLLKTQRIQPWSSETEVATSRFPWMKVYPSGLVDSQTAEPQILENSPSQVRTHAGTHLSEAGNQMAQPEANPRLSLIELPASVSELPAPITSPTAITEKLTADVEASAETQLTPPDWVSYDLKSQEVWSEADLTHPLDTVVQPLADLLAAAVNSVIPAVISETSSVQPNSPKEPDLSLTELGTQTTLASLEVVPDPEDAEDALWQDLARLIEVSTEDVVRASLSGDFLAFEAIDFNAVPFPNEASLSPLETSSSDPQTRSPHPLELHTPELHTPRIAHPRSSPTVSARTFIKNLT